MASGLEKDLRERIAQRRIQGVVGSGVSIRSAEKTPTSWEVLWLD